MCNGLCECGGAEHKCEHKPFAPLELQKVYQDIVTYEESDL